MAETLQIGEIVSWTAPSKVLRADLLVALTTAGLSEDMAPEMLPRNAFKRAVRELEDGKIIRQCEEDVDHIAFQFTTEFLTNGEYEYATECFVKVNKSTGECTGTDQQVADLAHEKLVEKMEVRNASDISRMIQALFKRNGDLFSVREAGGCYFVPQMHVGLVEQVQELVDLIGGSVRRFEICNTQNATKSAAQAVKDQLDQLVSEFESYVDLLSSESAQQVNTATKKIAEIKTKTDAYKDLLGDYCKSFEETLGDMNSKLMEKLNVESVVAPAPAPVVSEDVAASAADLLKNLIAQAQSI